LRQQKIIQAIIDKLTSSSMIFNPAKAKATYNNATQFIKTNLTMDEVLWGLPYIGTIKHKSSWQLAACANYKREYSQA
jgi:anionic cell wall polymer biosynthesis LytR-Cps2A-Psr (LCP) family protein